MIHTPDPQLFERAINILVVGCGGNGSAIVGGSFLYLHQALLALLSRRSERGAHRSRDSKRNQLRAPAVLPNGNRTL